MFALLLAISRLMCNLCFDKFELESNLCVAAQHSSCNISLSLSLAWLIEAAAFVVAANDI